MDRDCPPQLSDGIGPGLLINANLFQGNTAESGSGGGLRLQSVNGNDILNNPGTPANWYRVRITNNVIVDNVAGWTGGGVSMEDAVLVDFINNTVDSNDNTASAGVLFDTLGAANANVPPPGCNPLTLVGCTNPIVTSTPQPAGLTTERTSLNLQTAFTVPVTCPTGHPNCTRFSNPLLENDIFWHNRTFNIQPGTAQGTQNVITLNPTLSQTVTGSCPGDSGPGVITGGTGTPSFWDIGVYGDTGPTNHGSGFTMNPTFSILTSTAGYTGAGLRSTNPAVVSQYCNGSRVPPETASQTCTSTSNAPGCSTTPGTTVNPGIPDINPFYPVYNLSPAATVDEGNNWINMLYGPLTLSNEANYTAAGTVLAPLGNYSITSGSPAVDNGTSSSAPTTDFFGTPRPQGGGWDIGAVELVGGNTAPNATVTGGPLSFGNWANGTTSTAQTLTLSNNSNVVLTGISQTFSAGSRFSRAGGTCAGTLAARASCTINIVFSPNAVGAFNSTVTINASGAVTGSPVSLSGTGAASRATVSITPNPLTITLATGSNTATGTVRLTNTAAAGGSQVAVTNVVVSGGSSTTYTFTAVPGNTCTGTALAPGASCTVSVRFTNFSSPRGVNRTGTITFTDNATGSPQAGSLIGFATP